MMEILGLVLAICIGITLGMMGSGGSILTVPVLVYVFKVDPNLATTYSLFAIGASACVGSINNYFKGNIDFRKVLNFGFPSVVTVFFTRQYILPLIPDEFHIGKWTIHQNLVLMILFAIVMIYSALNMINGSISIKKMGEEGRYNRLAIAIQGAGVGFVTGVVGAGGGFLIIPALINFYKLPMTSAVSTSLAIICINSLFGLAGDLEKFSLFDWQTILVYTGLLLSGMFLGFYLVRFFSNTQLKVGLGYLILVIGLVILFKEVFLH